jgi:hypothetical protein
MGRKVINKEMFQNYRNWYLMLSKIGRNGEWEERGGVKYRFCFFLGQLSECRDAYQEKK